LIEVRVGRLEDVSADAALRPVACDFSPVNPAMRRFDQAAGAAVAQQCGQLGVLPLGSAVITAGGELPVPFIVHAAGRSATENATPSSVRLALLNGLRRLEQWGFESVAIAPFGTGAGNLDAEESAEAMVPVLVQQLRAHGNPTRAILVVEDDYQRAAFAAVAGRPDRYQAAPDR
jgi:O-acetyl-ADP-ribose deacetylase (regulator of RNase III)